MQSLHKTFVTVACCLLLFTALQKHALAQDGGPWSLPETWLCKPGRQDLCSVPVARSTVNSDGSVVREELRPDANAPVDCFYIYPTISTDPNGNSSLVPGPGERRAVTHQFSMFSSVCRPFAPMYRQATLAGLRAVLSGNPNAVDPVMAYNDVVGAWNYYLEFENKGRGVVLVGHSQGSRMLMQLIQREIEGKPIQARIVSVLLPGLNIEFAQGSDRGGTFKTMPLCASKGDVGCLVAFASFRANSPPPANARFGLSRTSGLDVACVDPVALSGVPISSYLPTKTNLLGSDVALLDWVDMRNRLDTSYVNLPGLLSTRCVKDGAASYLSVAFAPGVDDKRPKDIPGEMVSGGRILKDWGLHLLDINMVAGNLLEIVRSQALTYQARLAK